MNDFSELSTLNDKPVSPDLQTVVALSSGVGGGEDNLWSAISPMLLPIIPEPSWVTIHSDRIKPIRPQSLAS
jgi:hypothetical protein